MNLSKSQRPYHILLLPIFFVLHRVTENYGYISLGSAAKQALIYAVAGVILTGLFYLIIKSLIRAGLLAGYLLAVNFFYGNIFDFLEQHLPHTFLTRYTFLITFFLLGGILLFVLVRKKNISRVTYYLNILFVILIVVEIGSIIIHAGKNKDHISLAQADPKYVNCSTCPKPDVYIIILDEYAGAEQLRRVFEFDNSVFLDSLARRKFRTVHSSFSNYNFTPYSIASLLNRRHLDSLITGYDRKKGYSYALEAINANSFFPFFQDLGYQFFNHSYFRVSGIVAPTSGVYIPANKTLLTEPTFIARFEKNVLANLARRYNMNGFLKKSLMENKKNDDALFTLTQKVAAISSKTPRIVFTHFTMPHYPYYYDENGALYPIEKLKDISIRDKRAYLNYLKYANGKAISLIDYILIHAPSPPVILLLSDHGFRHTKSKEFPEHVFSNLMSVHLPDQNYTAFRDSMTNVNVLTALLNTVFGQHLPLVKDDKHLVSF